MRTALIGLGGVARRIHLPAISQVPRLELVGAAEPSAEARAAAGRWKIPEVFPDAARMLESTRPEFVIVGTPPDLHAEHVKMALESGAHVLCEKPFVARIDQADDLIALASRSGRLLAVNNQYRYMQIYSETRRRIANGEFGPLYLAQAWQQMFHPAERERNWRARLTRYTVFEFGTHVLDLLSFFFDALPAAVTARIPAVPHGYASDVLAVLLLDFPGERVATLNLHRVSRAPTRYLEMRLDARDASLRLSLGGIARLSFDWSGGSPRVRGSLVRGGEARVEREGRSAVIVRSPRLEFARATARHLEQIVGRIESGDVDPAAAIHAREILRTVFAAYRSAETRGTIGVPEFRD